MPSQWRMQAYNPIPYWIVESYSDSNHIITWTTNSPSLQSAIDAGYDRVDVLTGTLTGFQIPLIAQNVSNRTTELEHSNVVEGFLLPGDHCEFGAGGGG